MKIAVYKSPKNPISINRYIENVTRELNSMDVKTMIFSDDARMPGHADLYWDPRAAGGDPPLNSMVLSDKPYVVTLHGAAPFSLPAREYFSTYKMALASKMRNTIKYYKWKTLKRRPEAIITVSEYAKKEICKHLPLKNDIVFPIYHGVDQNIFNTSGKSGAGRPHLLHISQCQSKKNLKRIVEAYKSLDVTDKPALVAIVPGCVDIIEAEGLTMSNTPVNHKKLVEYYQGAIGFIFPSLHETFGMPILEAMASGCPVITSNLSACSEIAGDAALLVDPRSTDEISSALQKLILEADLRESLSNKGIRRAKMFTWEKSARKHLDVFQKALEGV